MESGPNRFSTLWIKCWSLCMCHSYYLVLFKEGLCDDQVKSLYALLHLCLLLHGAIRGDCLCLSHLETLTVLNGRKETFFRAGFYVWFSWFKPPAIKAAFRQKQISTHWLLESFCPSFCKAASVTHSLSSNGTSSLCLVAAGASVVPASLLPVRSCWRQGGQHPPLISFRVSISLFSGTDMLIQTIQSLRMPVRSQSAGASAELLHVYSLTFLWDWSQ